MKNTQCNKIKNTQCNFTTILPIHNLIQEPNIKNKKLMSYINKNTMQLN